MKEGRQIGGEQGVREGVKEDLLRAGRREMKEEQVGSTWTDGGSEGGREGMEGEK